jgi:uncharacterized membrane protein
VSPHFRWMPLITFLQLVADMTIATTSPTGYGHIFAAEHYIPAWIAVTDPPGIGSAEIQRLKAHLAEPAAN